MPILLFRSYIYIHVIFSSSSWLSVMLVRVDPLRDCFKKKNKRFPDVFLAHVLLQILSFGVEILDTSGVVSYNQTIVEKIGTFVKSMLLWNGAVGEGVKYLDTCFFFSIYKSFMHLPDLCPWESLGKSTADIRLYTHSVRPVSQTRHQGYTGLCSSCWTI